MSEFFEKCSPMEVGIPNEYILNFSKNLENKHLPMHSIMIMRNNKLIYESFYSPYTKDSLHRMFSITKSFVSLGIGLLIDEGKLSLDDHIIDFFKDKLPKGEIHPYLSMLTIRDMLEMKTCHRFTTYKSTGVSDWLGSFFTTKPTHVPGTNFAYDTSSTHTLGILIERLSGMNFLDYLRSKFLDELEFSKDAYIMKDPTGMSMGGSGLNCSPYDILKVFYLVVHKGNWFGKQLLPYDYITDAINYHSDNWAKSDVLEEMQGYGYQFWRTSHNGYAMYGMGGQLAIYVPDKDIILITTADAQGRKGGVQLIYDTFWNEIIDKLDYIDNINTNSKVNVMTNDGVKNDTIADYNNDIINVSNQKVTNQELLEYANSRKLEVMEKCGPNFTKDAASFLDKINNRTYVALDNNNCTVKNLTITINPDKRGGKFSYSNAYGNFNIDFGFGYNIIQKFANYNYRIAACASIRNENLLDIKIQVIDEVLGNIYFALNFKDPYITVMMRKIEEHTFDEYDGVFSAKLEKNQ